MKHITREAEDTIANTYVTSTLFCEYFYPFISICLKLWKVVVQEMANTKSIQNEHFYVLLWQIIPRGRKHSMTQQF